MPSATVVVCAAADNDAVVVTVTIQCTVHVHMLHVGEAKWCFEVMEVTFCFCLIIMTNTVLNAKFYFERHRIAYAKSLYGSNYQLYELLTNANV